MSFLVIFPTYGNGIGLKRKIDNVLHLGAPRGYLGLAGLGSTKTCKTA